MSDAMDQSPVKIVVPTDADENGLNKASSTSSKLTTNSGPLPAKRSALSLWKTAGNAAGLEIPSLTTVSDETTDVPKRRSDTMSKKRSEELIRTTLSAFKRDESSAAVARAAQLATAPRLASATKVRMFAGTARHKDVIKEWREVFKTNGLFVILDVDPLYQAWFCLTVAAAVIQGFITPYSLAFHGRAGWSRVDSYTAIHVVMLGIFVLDMIVNFFVSKIVKDRRIIDPWEIKIIYLRGMFWVDLISIIPFDAIILAMVGFDVDPRTKGYLSLFALLTLLRMYRVLKFFHFLEINISVSQFTITLVRNFVYVFFVVHWAACMFYFTARQDSFAESTWVGQSSIFFEGRTPFERYLVSVYWSTTTFATVGYGDLHAYSVGECVFCFVYMGLNVVLGAYIIGTITLLVVRHDEKARVFRDMMRNLHTYSHESKLDEGLRDDIHTYLELQLRNHGLSDEQITEGLPATLRRRVLRSVYREKLADCYLFRTHTSHHFPQKFLDALLAASHVEVFMPMVDIVSEMEIVNELYIIINGSVDVMRRLSPGMDDDLILDAQDSSVYAGNAGLKKMPSLPGLRTSQSYKVDKLGDISVRSGSEYLKGEPLYQVEAGNPFGEVAFFTHQPSRQAMKAGIEHGCKTLVISREKYAAICADYPRAARLVLENLQRRVYQTMRLKRSSMRSLQGLDDPDAPEEDWDNDAEMDEVKFAVERLLREDTEKHVNSFLYAAAKGDFYSVKKMLEKGRDVNCADYDKRSALMLAAAGGYSTVVNLLLEKGANVDAKDNFGTTALIEAVEKGQDVIVELLVRKGARLTIPEDKLSGKLCQLVQDQMQAHLKRFFKAKANPNAADYDRRTPLHVASAEGNLTMVKLLVEAGSDPTLVDRWGSTPLDEALRVGSAPVVDYLESLLKKDHINASRLKLHDENTKEMLTACSDGSVAVVKKLLDHLCPPDIADYDNRTGLMLATVGGHLPVVKVLLGANANPNLKDNFGGTALYEACRNKQVKIIEELLAAGGTLGHDENDMASLLCNCVYKKDYPLLEMLLLAGANVDSADYDKRTALHVAAAEGNLKMVAMLITKGGATVTLKDRWGNTALDEAQRIGSTPVVQYLQDAMAGRQIAAASEAGDLLTEPVEKAAAESATEA